MRLQFLQRMAVLPTPGSATTAAGLILLSSAQHRTNVALRCHTRDQRITYAFSRIFIKVHTQ